MRLESIVSSLGIEERLIGQGKRNESACKFLFQHKRDEGSILFYFTQKKNSIARHFVDTYYTKHVLCVNCLV